MPWPFSKPWLNYKEGSNCFSQSVLIYVFSPPLQALLGSAVDVMLLMSVDSRKLVFARGTVQF